MTGSAAPRRHWVAGVSALLLAVWLVAARAGAETLTGRVLWVDDGDSFVVRDDEGRRYRVRLRGIDAPERAQPYASVSRRNLSRLARGRTVTVTYEGVDKYGRVLGWVHVDDGVSVNLLQVQAGLAWHYAIRGRPWTADDDLLARAEHDARLARRGLWARPSPQPPWQYRRDHRDEPWRAGR
jgi:endonuclease YncB( thermonuclease family)